MTLEELYAAMEGDYDQAVRVLRIEKLIDKHIRKFPNNEIFDVLAEADAKMDGEGLFEAAHAIKGVCANLGLTKISVLASEVCEDFRSGRPRSKTDEEIHALVKEILRLRQVAIDALAAYAA